MRQSSPQAYTCEVRDPVDAFQIVATLDYEHGSVRVSTPSEAGFYKLRDDLTPVGNTETGFRPWLEFSCKDRKCLEELH